VESVQTVLGTASLSGGPGQPAASRAAENVYVFAPLRPARAWMPSSNSWRLAARS